MSDIFQELTWRGLIAQATDDDMKAATGDKRLTVYFGCDPTADSLHVGNLVGLITMKRFQQAGHRPIVLAGGSTGMIGDPSFKASERKLLDEDTMSRNIAGIKKQLVQLLDFSEGDNQAILVNNYDWTREVNVLDFLRDIGKHFTINQMIAKDSVRTRLTEREQGISYTEFSYSLLQAMDYLHLHRSHNCDVQVGGSDQWGNIVAGVDLVRRAEAKKVHALCWPLVTKADGTKFGKTESGAVWLSSQRTSPYAFHQFFLRSEDAVVGNYLRYYTFLKREEIESLEDSVRAEPAKRLAQHRLADEVTSLLHGPEEAARARRAGELLFSGDFAAMDENMLTQVFADVKALDLSRDRLDETPLVDVLVDAGLSGSKSQARTALCQGGVSINGVKVEGDSRRLERGDLLHDRFVVLRRGKKEFALVRFQ